MKLMLLDPSEIFRIGLRTCLAARRPDVEVLEELERPDDERIVAAMPDVLVAELSLPGTNAIALCRRLRRTGSSIRVLILTARAPAALWRQALAAGALGCVAKTQSACDIVDALATMVDGGAFVPAPAVANGSPAFEESGFSTLDALSQREREIFDLVAWGYTNRAIAAELEISIKTVETHRTHVHKKLGVRTAADVVRYASFCGVLNGTPRTAALVPALRELI